MPELKFANGETVLAYDGAAWYEATILQNSGYQIGEEIEYFVHYIGWSDRFDEWLTEESLQQLLLDDTSNVEIDLKLRNGYNILCYYEKSLYETKIIETRTSESGRKWYKIHYSGWSTMWDEWVTRDRLHLKTNESAYPY